jgi:hypothetical protein
MLLYSNGTENLGQFLSLFKKLDYYMIGFLLLMTIQGDPLIDRLVTGSYFGLKKV